MADFLIRAESNALVCEQRVPLVPECLQEYSERFVIEPSQKRIIPNYEYSGALKWDVSYQNLPLVLGIKPPDPEMVTADGQVHACFSHVIKGQSENMPLLQKIIDQKATLVDYECIRDSATGKRLLGFGLFAGIVGAVEGILALNEIKKNRDLIPAVPGLKRTSSIEALQDHFSRLTSIHDLRMLILGTGQVAKGALAICEKLGLPKIYPSQLENWDNFRSSWFCQASIGDVVVHHQGKPFDPEEYYEYGKKRYQSILSTSIASPNLLVNGLYWDEKYPRLLSEEDFRDEGTILPDVVADISCDIDGSLVCTVKETTLESPWYSYFPDTGEIREDIELGSEGSMAVMSVGNLPSVMPRCASRDFSKSLVNFIPELIRLSKSNSIEDADLSPEIRGSLIVYKGELQPKFKYLESFLGTRV